MHRELDERNIVTGLRSTASSPNQFNVPDKIVGQEYTGEKIVDLIGTKIVV